MSIENLNTLKFQSTLPRRERHKASSCKVSGWHFNPRSREGSDWNGWKQTKCSKHFNPRSREGSDDKEMRTLKNNNFISIHAPAKGATIPNCSNLFSFIISIHAPAKGATNKVSMKPEDMYISIHAPAKGATYFHLTEEMSLLISIHAPAKGATL